MQRGVCFKAYCKPYLRTEFLNVLHYTACYSLLVQVKYFDSGDYAMAKSEKKKGGPAAAINRGKPMPCMPLAVGKAIPTPENIPHRKTSVPSKLVDPHDQLEVAVTRQLNCC